MIKKNEQPQTWSVPDWHPDFGNAEVELAHLRSLAEALLAMMPNAQVALEIPEPGIMNLAIELPDGTVAEVYSIPAGGCNEARRFGLFFAPGTDVEQEVYADSLDDAMSHFTVWTHAARAGEREA